MIRNLVLVIVFAIIVKGLTIYWALTHGTLWLAHLYTDVFSWSDFFHNCLQHRIPYVHFRREYPVGAGVIYWLMSQFLPNTSAAFAPGDLLRVHMTFMSVFEVANVGLFYVIVSAFKKSRHPLLLTLLFFLVPTGLVLLSVRFEAVVITTVLLGYYFHLKKKPHWATFFWSLGATLKWYPFFFIVAKEYENYKRGNKKQWIKSAVIFAAVNICFNAPFLIGDWISQGNIDNWLAIYQFHINRPLYWDTLLGVWILWTGYHRLELYGAYWTLALVGLAAVVKPRLKFEYRCVLICVAAIICNRVYSTQFNLWFYPFILFALNDETDVRFRHLLALYVALDLTNIFVYPFSFAPALEEMGGFAPLAAATRGHLWTALFSDAIILRAVLLAWLSVFVLNSRTPKQINKI